mmetsp:Transcript_13221/g.24753  ORF Transcript_13221/g.24753 Transcript_13221/m.24753 type:complete len:213 (+) Transcript_13221:963-1601(+)
MVFSLQSRTAKWVDGGVVHWRVLTPAEPTPLVAAHLARYMVAPFLFLYSASALRALLDRLAMSPFAIREVDSFFTRFLRVPLFPTVEAHRHPALPTIKSRLPWIGISKDRTATRVRTPPGCRVKLSFLVELESLVLEEEFIRQQSFQPTHSEVHRTACMRTLQPQHAAFTDTDPKVVNDALSAEAVSALEAVAVCEFIQAHPAHISGRSLVC